MLKDEVYRFMRNELLLCRTYFILLTPVDPWKMEGKNTLFHFEMSNQKN